MLALTKKTEYGLIALKYIHDHGVAASAPGPVSAREIAEFYHMPLPLLMNILKDLAAAGVLLSSRGVKGGYALGLDLRQLTLSKLITIIEGPARLVDCACDQGCPPGTCNHPQHHKAGDCRIVDTCPIQDSLKVLHDHIMRFMDTVTVYEICLNKLGGSNGCSGCSNGSTGGTAEKANCAAGTPS